MTDTLLTGPSHAPASGGAPKQLVVFLHGRGANGDDLIGLAPVMAQHLPDAMFLSPDAPLSVDGFPPGLQWFDSGNRDPEHMTAGVRAAAPAIDAYLDHHLAENGLTDANLAIFGFSQGCRMTLHVGLRRQNCPAVLLGFSGSLAAPESLAAEITVRPPVLLVHGDADDIVPYSSLAIAETALKDVGVVVEAVSRPGLGHGIDNEGFGFAVAHTMQAFGVEMG
ncbi:MAG: prolyl oligopeptidase family serine peptidase [Alphaproteobacteria bacterium]|nr:prolyl oligopeptidase family serine peptidase [Alphaproteobacteria bacterium]